MKVLFVTYKLQSYRIPIFDRIGKEENIELTVLHSAKKSDYNGGNFEERTINFKKLGSFTYYNKEFTNLVKQHDVAVCMFYLFNLSFLKLALNGGRNTKLIFWGIGVRASYNSNFDDPTIMNHVRYFLARKSNAMLFYSDYAKKKYAKKGVSEEKLFVMPNTVEVLDNRNQNVERNRILFIGSLYKQKKIFELLNAYKIAVDRFDGRPLELHIVGGGGEFEAIKKWISFNELGQSIIMHGPVFEEQKLAELFTSALGCISPGQAGLSVLKSFGYGVPFITHENAITGGERLNIEHQKNGILFKEYDELPDIILNIFQDPNRFITMGEKARAFYYNQRTIEIMAQGFIDACQFATKNTK
ncbi:glycosyltransferase [Flagellimonas sp. 2504JD4-2]